MACPKLNICKRGHSPERRNKHGQCMDCANLVRRKGKTYPTHCKRGHVWIQGQRRCQICRDEASRERSKKQITELHDTYVKNSLKWKDAPPDLLEVARLKIILKREMKLCKSAQ